MSAQRRLCLYRFGRWLIQSGVMRAARAVLRAIVDMIDHSTGATHRRFPMTVESIAERCGFSARTVQRCMPDIERTGLVMVERAKPQRMPDGTFRQVPNLYRLTLPDECWTEVRPVADTPAARQEDALARPIDRPRAKSNGVLRQVLDAAAKALTVSGRLSTRDAAPIGQPYVERDEQPELVGVDGVQVEELAGQMVLAAQLAAASCPEERRFVAVAGIERMQTRARELATETTKLGLVRDHVLACVRQWVARTLANGAQHVRSAEHAVNILRRFFVAKVQWQERDVEAAIAESTGW